jgi:hypothetical protein
MTNAELQEHYDRTDAKRCRKGRHETNRPIWMTALGGIAGWRCFCGDAVEKKKDRRNLTMGQCTYETMGIRCEGEEGHEVDAHGNGHTANIGTVLTAMASGSIVTAEDVALAWVRWREAKDAWEAGDRMREAVRLTDAYRA